MLLGVYSPLRMPRMNTGCMFPKNEKKEVNLQLCRPTTVGHHAARSGILNRREEGGISPREISADRGKISLWCEIQGCHCHNIEQ